MSKTLYFQLQFEMPDYHQTRKRIVDLAAEYMKSSTRSGVPNHLMDEKAKIVGELIRLGDNIRENLEIIIYDWKLEASETRFNQREKLFTKNDTEDLTSAVRRAIHTHDDRTAVDALCQLAGVKVPVASAILTWIHPDPERYTVIDVRALRSLGVTVGKGEDVGSISVTLYLAYLKYCRAMSKYYDVCLRTFDRALWQAGAVPEHHACFTPA